MEITATPKQLERVLKFNISINKPTLVVGSPGIGKSDIFKSVTESLGYKLVLRHGVTDDPLDYKGLGGFSSPGRAEFTPFGDLLELIETKEKVFCFFDDLGQAPQSVQAAIMQLLLARTVNGHRISDTVVFGAATNRREDKSAVQAMVQALMSRFDIVDLRSAVNDWVSWALRSTIPLPLVAACKMKPEWIETWKPSKDIANSPNPRNVAEVGKTMNANPDQDLLPILFSARLGFAATTELLAYLDTYKELPTIDEICMSPKQARLPLDPSAKYVISEALVKRTNTQCVDNVFTYMERLDKEYQAMYVKGLCTENKDMCDTLPYVDWCNENQGILI